jgi:hypothetical protein
MGRVTRLISSVAFSIIDFTTTAFADVSGSDPPPSPDC